MKQKTETVTIGTHKLSLSYPVFETMSDLVDDLPSSEFIDLVNTYQKKKALAEIRALVSPPIKTKRALAYNSFSAQDLKTLEDNPALFQRMLTDRITQMETNNDFFRILNPSASEGNSTEPAAKTPVSATAHKTQGKDSQIQSAAVQDALS
jgi:hypothetical protein